MDDVGIDGRCSGQPTHLLFCSDRLTRSPLMLWSFSKSYKGPLPPLTDQQKALSARLSNHVWILAGDIGARSLTSAPENLEKAAQYIEHVFRKHDYTTSVQEFDCDVRELRKGATQPSDVVHKTYKTRNIIAELKGTKIPDEIVVVGAHYDSVYDCPAANDNGSGVAALLEISGALRKVVVDRTIRFVAFTNEEPPFFRTEQMGSWKYAHLCHERKEKIKAMLSLETMGYFSDEPNSQSFPHSLLKRIYPNTGNFIAFVSNLQSRVLLDRSIIAFRKKTKFPSEAIAAPVSLSGIDFSDQYAFWKLGYPAIMITDTAHLRYPHYHEAEDTPDKVDYDALARVTSGITEVILNLARK